MFKEPINSKSNYWLQTLILKKKSFKLRNKIINYSNVKGFSTRPVWKTLHKLKHFRKSPKMKLNITENLEERIINLPSSAYLGAHKF